MKDGFFILQKIETPYGYWIEALCLSTVEKPTDYATNSVCVELDTGDPYYLDNGTWKKIGG